MLYLQKHLLKQGTNLIQAGKALYPANDFANLINLHFRTFAKINVTFGGKKILTESGNQSLADTNHKNRNIHKK